MRSQFFSVVALLTGAGLVFAQANPVPQLPATAPAAPKASPTAATTDPPGQASTDCGDGLINGTPLCADSPCCTPASKPCRDPWNVWTGGEYLRWRMKDAPDPAGGFGLFGTGLDYNSASGLRVSAGVNSEDCHAGIETNFFMFERRAANQAADAPGGISIPPVFSIPAGSDASTALIEMNRLWGADVLITKAAFGGTGGSFRWEVDLLGGFQYMDLEERLVATTASMIPGPPDIGFPPPPPVFQFGNTFIPGPANVSTVATFQTRNQFYGTELGARAEFQYWRVFANIYGHCGIGEVHQQLQSTTFITANTPGGTDNFSVSTHELRDGLAIIPQVTCEAGFNVTRNIRIYGGYDYLYWNNVVRPGDQILAGVPGVGLQQTYFWAHGWNAGFAIRF